MNPATIQQRLPAAASPRRCANSACFRRFPELHGVLGRHKAGIWQTGQPSKQHPAQKACGLAPSRAPRRALACCAAGDRPGQSGPPSSGGVAFNPIYLVITGAFTALLLFRNPYIYAALTVLTVLPQNSNVTSLNNLVLLFYESGLFMNFAEAVYCVRLVTWLSMGFMVFAFAIFR